MVGHPSSGSSASSLSSSTWKRLSVLRLSTITPGWTPTMVPSTAAMHSPCGTLVFLLAPPAQVVLDRLHRRGHKERRTARTYFGSLQSSGRCALVRCFGRRDREGNWPFLTTQRWIARIGSRDLR